MHKKVRSKLLNFLCVLMGCVCPLSQLTAESISYSERFAFAEIQVASGFTLCRVAIEQLPFAGPELLDEKGDPTQGASTRTQLTQLRRDIATTFDDLQKPPPEFKAAYEHLESMYAMFERFAAALLDNPEPQPMTQVQVNLIKQRFDHMRKILRDTVPPESER
jgi:hypothetical protein